MIFLMNRHVSLNLCVSSDVKRTLLRYGVSEEKLRVQPIGSVIAETQKTDIHPLHDPLVVGNIGGVRYYKGTHVLVDALSKLSRDSYRLKIFGPFDQDYMKGMLKGKENLPIEFLGWYNPQDLPGILEQIDIMVLPSICKDTAPQTIFESYSARIPIVASEIGGFTDFIQDGINGHLFAPGNSDELALKLDELLRNPDRIKAFSDNIPRLKTIRENARELTALYQETGPAEDKRISG
jgi:glycosyltransferase involved in cell wall biosynthesis